MLKYQTELEEYGIEVVYYPAGYNSRWVFFIPGEKTLQRGNRKRAEELAELLYLRHHVKNLKEHSYILGYNDGIRQALRLLEIDIEEAKTLNILS